MKWLIGFSLTVFLPLAYIHVPSAKEKQKAKQIKADTRPVQKKTKTSTRRSIKVQKATAKKTKTEGQTHKSVNKRKANIHSRKVSQISSNDTHLNQSVESLAKLFDELPLVCQNENPLYKRVKDLQQRLIAIKQKIHQIKKDFRMRDPSVHSYINTLHFYFNKSEDFNYEREIPKNKAEIEEYVENLAVSFQYMYQVAFNIPEDTSGDKLPGWGRPVGTALACLKNTK